MNKCLATLILTMGVTVTASATDLHISNASPYVMFIKYKTPYHQQGQDVVYGHTSEMALGPHAYATVQVQMHANAQTGLVVVAVKKPDGQWVMLPASARQFGGFPGCSMIAGKQDAHRHIELSEKRYKNGHGRIMCYVTV